MKKSLIFLGLNFAVLNSVFSILPNQDTTDLTINITGVDPTATIDAPDTLTVNASSDGTNIIGSQIGTLTTSGANGAVSIDINVSASTGSGLTTGDAISITATGGSPVSLNTGTNFNTDDQLLKASVSAEALTGTGITINYLAPITRDTGQILTTLTFTAVAS